MSRPPNGRYSDDSDSIKRAHPRPRHAVTPTDSDSHANGQAAGSARCRHSRDSLLGSMQALDESSGIASVIADELKEMRSRVWWRRPSALWLLCMEPFVLAASASTTAPKVQVVTYLVCKTLRPEYTDRSGMGRLSAAFAPNNEGIKLCNADPVVQAASAEFLTLITAVTGVLSFLTVAYWGSRSDRKGRVNALRISVFGHVITDFTYLLVYSLSGDRKGTYWFLLIGPLIGGLLGGPSAVSANVHAYVADCTDSAHLSRVFSVFQGLANVGGAVGPALGGLLIRQSGNLRTVFYYAFASHCVFASMVWLVLPESLTPTQLSKAKLSACNENMAQPRRGIGSFLARLVSFLAPLKLFVPVGVAGSDNPLKKRKDWNLTLLAAAHGFVNTLLGTYSFKLQYAAMTFGWGAELLGYWKSVAAFTRAVTLAFLTPAVISLLEGLSSPTQLSIPSAHTAPLSPVARDPEAPRNHLAQPVTPPIPTRGPDAQRPPITTTPHLSTRPNPVRTAVAAAESKDPSTSRLDLNVTRASLFIELTSYAMMATAKTGAMFTVYTILGGLAAGYTPVIQSLTLEVYIRRGGEEIGKLFAGLNVMHTLGGSILSPVLFGFTYSRTVATFPQAIFVVAALAISLALLCTVFIRLPQDRVVMGDGPSSDEERERLLSSEE